MNQLGGASTSDNYILTSLFVRSDPLTFFQETTLEILQIALRCTIFNFEEKLKIFSYVAADGSSKTL